MVNIEDFKKNMVDNITKRELMPQDIMNIIKTAFKGISKKYEQLQCSNLPIQEYIEGKFEEAKVYINENIGKRRREEQLEQLQYILLEIERDLEQLQDEDKQRANENRHTEEFIQLEGNNRQTTADIMEVIREDLIDIQSVQNRNLDARGYSMERMEQIEQSIWEFISNFKIQGEKQVFETLNQDDATLQKQLLQQYETYLKTKIDKKTEMQVFKELLDSKISLEEQYNFAIEQGKQQEISGKVQEGLPENLLK